VTSSPLSPHPSPLTPLCLTPTPAACCCYLLQYFNILTYAPKVMATTPSHPGTLSPFAVVTCNPCHNATPPSLYRHIRDAAGDLRGRRRGVSLVWLFGWSKLILSRWTAVRSRNNSSCNRHSSCCCSCCFSFPFIFLAKIYSVFFSGILVCRSLCVMNFYCDGAFGFTCCLPLGKVLATAKALRFIFGCCIFMISASFPFPITQLAPHCK